MCGRWPHIPREKGDFADYVIREHGLVAGCTTVAKFDQALLKEPGYRSPYTILRSSGIRLEGCRPTRE